jgi:hypothetical protein
MPPRLRRFAPIRSGPCRDAGWLEHRLLVAARLDRDNIADVIIKIYECRQEFVGQPFLTGR